jgi:hypothetical protein
MNNKSLPRRGTLTRHAHAARELQPLLCFRANLRGGASVKPHEIDQAVHELILRWNKGESNGKDLADWLDMDEGQWHDFVHEGEFREGYVPPIRPIPAPEVEASPANTAFDRFCIVLIIAFFVGSFAWVIHVSRDVMK